MDADRAAAAQPLRPRYHRLYDRVAATREGRPTILRAHDRHDDWIG